MTPNKCFVVIKSNRSISTVLRERKFKLSKRKEMLSFNLPVVLKRHTEPTFILVFGLTYKKKKISK